MAVKTLAENVTLLQKVVAMRENARSFGAYNLTTDANAVSAAIDAGDDVPEDTETGNKLEAVIKAYEDFFKKFDDLFNSVLPHLGRLAGSPSLQDTDLCVAKWNEYLHTNSLSIESSGLTISATLTANGSNVGTGKMAACVVDAESLVPDVGHIETKTIRCTKDATQGATAGREEFTIYGTDNANKRAWEDKGSAVGQGYTGVYGKGSKEWPANIQIAQSKLTSVGAASGAGNLLLNGDFETAISGTGTAKLDSWTISTGDTTLTQASTAGTDLIAGVYSLKTTANCKFYQNVANSKVKAGCAYAIGGKLRTINGGSGTVTGTLTIKVMSRDDATTYATFTQAIGSLTVNTNEQPALATFVLPKAHKDLKVEVELASIGGTAATPTLAIDDVIFSEAILVDGGRAIAIHDGSNVNASGMTTGRWKYNDEYTTATTGSYTGLVERAFNEIRGRYVKHNSSPVTFVDPTIEPEISVDRVADGGTDALGTVTVAAHDYTYTVTNNGNAPLFLTDLATGSDSNTTSAIVTNFGKNILLPGESTTFVIRTTPAGAGAFSSAITFDNNDSGESPYNWTLSGTAA